MYDPSRLEVEYEVMVGDRTVVGAGVEGMRMLDGEPDHLEFWGMGVGSNGLVRVEVRWPEGGLATNVLEVFGCTKLSEGDWLLMGSWEVGEGTNRWEWDDDGSTNEGIRFYDVWAGYDSDADGLTDGREKRIYKTDMGNADTDGDGLLDGSEVNPPPGELGSDPRKADTDGGESMG